MPGPGSTPRALQHGQEDIAWSESYTMRCLPGSSWTEVIGRRWFLARRRREPEPLRRGLAGDLRKVGTRGRLGKSAAGGSAVSVAGKHLHQLPIPPTTSTIHSTPGVSSGSIPAAP